MSAASFWAKIPATDYIQTLRDVIPSFWKQPDVVDLTQNKHANKTNLQKILSPYLKKIVQISDGEVTKDEYLCYTGNVSLENLSGRFDQLAFFLKLDDTNLPAISRRASQAKTVARKAIFSANGTEISSLQRYKVVMSPDESKQRETEEMVEFDEILT